MKPILFRFFDVAVPSYTVLMVLGYVAALLVLWRLTPKDGRPEGGGLTRPQVWDLFIVMTVSSVIGSKLGHVLFEAPGHKRADGTLIRSLPELLVDDPWHWARLGEPGYVWYGGLIGALLVALFYFWRRPHLRAALYADTFAPAIMVGAAIGRFGCFLAGCCHGQPTSLPWGVQFPQLAGPVHPTQLYDAITAALLGAFLFLHYPRRRFDGENIAWLLILYPVMRTITEVFRGDAERGAFGPLSTSQLLSIPLLIAGLVLWSRGMKRGSRTTVQDGSGTQATS